ncbi:MAG: hypothetical protein QOE59_5115 [Actinomycetota bacterium]|jgi:uncharacterized membrane protein YgcG|nr:hypothetical protein [Actinomycetota bacterium]
MLLRSSHAFIVRLDFFVRTRTITGMAQKTVVSLLDDLDGESEADETVEYALDGVTYEIDLTTENAEDLRAIFAPYIAAARRTGGRRASGGGRSRPASSSRSGSSSSSSGSGIAARGRQALKEIRTWAKENGWTVSDRGRLPNNVVEAYESRRT